MAMSAKERKQNQLERERTQLKELDDSTLPFLRQPFFERVEEDPNWSGVTLALELCGFEPPSFEDDRGPQHFANEVALPPDEDPSETFPGFKGSIGRAEAMIDLLLEAASELANLVNRYKRDELAARRKEIEESDLSDPEERRTAIDNITQITRIEAELSKNVRQTLPIWKIKGL